MKLKSIKYSQYEQLLPQSGRHIVGQTTKGNIIVYQAFNPNIAKWAVAHQKFGGSHYKFTRMSWIKPNFLWMMYRAGWAMKEHEQHILAIEISKNNFETLLTEGVHSSYIEKIYSTPENWKSEMGKAQVRIQWDPDHHPNGEKLERRAIQIGIKGELLQKFATEWIISIEDITAFVREQKRRIDGGLWNELEVIKEEKITIHNPEIILKLELEN